MKVADILKNQQEKRLEQNLQKKERYIFIIIIIILEY